MVGADEVGRGALAGPLVAATVIFEQKSTINHAVQGQAFKRLVNRADSRVVINDSKKLSAKQRGKAEKWIKKNCLAWGIGVVSVSEINRLGMAKASKMVFRRAIVQCNLKLVLQGLTLQIQFLLIDAFYVPYTRGIKRKNQLAVVRGDEKSFSIAAASIIAKVYRDSLMWDMSKKHKNYKWDQNKGYGTREHQEAIQKYGITRLHRKMFVRKLLEQESERA